MTRRHFIKTATAAFAFPTIIPAKALGSNGTTPPSGRTTIGLIGTGGISARHREAFLAEADAQIVAVCDPIKSRAEAFRKRIDSAPGHRGCAAYRDFRELLARADIDAVCIATPDHWHAAQAIAAMRAGKDVYVEKPLTYSVMEGRRVVEVASRYGRILQTGLQRRSGKLFRQVCETVRNGRIGRLTHAEVGIVGIHNAAQPDAIFKPAAVPAEIDYDLWLGPAPEAPFCPERIINHYWYHILDYSRGFIPGNGVHYVDIAQWAIGDEVNPVRIEVPVATVSRVGLIDTVIYWHSEVIYENGVRMSFSSEGNPHPDGIRFVGSDGWIHIGGGGNVTASHGRLLKPSVGPGETVLYASPGPHRNFLDCIRSRKPTAANPEIGHHATTTCNLVEIAARLRRPLTWDVRAGRFADDDTANRLLSRPMRPPWHI